MQIHMKIWLLCVVDVFFLSQPCNRGQTDGKHREKGLSSLNNKKCHDVFNPTTVTPYS